MPGLPPTPIVLLHGYWHGTWCWAPVVAELAARGRSAVAVDMAGHGLHARRPEAARARPFSANGFAAEHSPVSHVSLDEAGELLVSQIKKTGGGRPCVLVAHSMSGTVANRAAEMAPDVISHLVYVCAFMPPTGIPASKYLGSPGNEGELLPALLRADPADVGALRLDPGSADPEYQALLRHVFYNDVDPVTADAAIALLSCDAPARIASGSTTLTTRGWGSVPRTYVHTTRDNIIRPVLQRRFVAQADEAFPDNPTRVVELDSSHSPFLSMPGVLAGVITHASPRAGDPGASHPRAGAPPSDEFSRRAAATG
ncbi:alpha/beta fold hydrolase [Streptomyces sp. NPDC088725]|uniref:alpha/beta fold hydrolase n=1 Tax=Streptomyces sp. NPDC088725 TaxID=3365873 RepID=UPI0038006651